MCRREDVSEISEVCNCRASIFSDEKIVLVVKKKYRDNKTVDSGVIRIFINSLLLIKNYFKKG